MILVFGGTTEGKIIATLLEEKRIPYIYSTKTNIDFIEGKYGNFRYGPFSVDSLEDFCFKQNIKAIVNGSHPFAIELHKTIFTVSSKHDLPVLRFERKEILKTVNPLVQYFDSYEVAMDYLLNNPISSLLALTGVQTISLLKNYWEKHTTYFRILPRDPSLAIAASSGIPLENIIQEFPNGNIDSIKKIILNKNIKGIITKESGDSGFLTQKIEAALQSGIPILIIKKPPVPSTFIKVFSREELSEQIDNLVL
jgi:precorrin-6x reductase